MPTTQLVVPPIPSAGGVGRMVHHTSYLTADLGSDTLEVYKAVGGGAYEAIPTQVEYAGYEGTNKRYLCWWTPEFINGEAELLNGSYPTYEIRTVAAATAATPILDAPVIPRITFTITSSAGTVSTCTPVWTPIISGPLFTEYKLTGTYNATSSLVCYITLYHHIPVLRVKPRIYFAGTTVGLKIRSIAIAIESLSEIKPKAFLRDDHVLSAINKKRLVQWVSNPSPTSIPGNPTSTVYLWDSARALNAIRVPVYSAGLTNLYKQPFCDSSGNLCFDPAEWAGSWNTVLGQFKNGTHADSTAAITAEFNDTVLAQVTAADAQGMSIMGDILVLMAPSDHELQTYNWQEVINSNLHCPLVAAAAVVPDVCRAIDVHTLATGLRCANRMNWTGIDFGRVPHTEYESENRPKYYRSGNPYIHYGNTYEDIKWALLRVGQATPGTTNFNNAISLLTWARYEVQYMLSFGFNVVSNQFPHGKEIVPWMEQASSYWGHWMRAVDLRAAWYLLGDRHALDSWTGWEAGARGAANPPQSTGSDARETFVSLLHVNDAYNATTGLSTNTAWATMRTNLINFITGSAMFSDANASYFFHPGVWSELAPASTTIKNWVKTGADTGNVSLTTGISAVAAGAVAHLHTQTSTYLTRLAGLLYDFSRLNVNAPLTDPYTYIGPSVLGLGHLAYVWPYFESRLTVAGINEASWNASITTAFAAEPGHYPVANGSTTGYFLAAGVNFDFDMDMYRLDDDFSGTITLKTPNNHSIDLHILGALAWSSATRRARASGRQSGYVEATVTNSQSGIAPMYFNTTFKSCFFGKVTTLSECILLASGVAHYIQACNLYFVTKTVSTANLVFANPTEYPCYINWTDPTTAQPASIQLYKNQSVSLPITATSRRIEVYSRIGGHCTITPSAAALCAFTAAELTTLRPLVP